MGLFVKKLPLSQETELQEFTGILREVYQRWEQALISIRSETRDLYYVCHQALEENRPLKAAERLPDIIGDSRRLSSESRWSAETVEIGDLIEKAKGSIQAYADFMADMQANILFRKPASWYPKKHRKAYDWWDSYYQTTRPNIEAAMAALRPPEPLKYDPRRESKLETFTRSLDAVVKFPRPALLPIDFDLRLEIERFKYP